MLTGDELSDSSVSLSMTAGDFTEVLKHGKSLCFFSADFYCFRYTGIDFLLTMQLQPVFSLTLQKISLNTLSSLLFPCGLEGGGSIWGRSFTTLQIRYSCLHVTKCSCKTKNGDQGEQSIELPLDDVYGAARVRPPPGPHEIPRVPYVATQMLGLREVTSSVVLSSYTDNPRAMSSVLYKSSFAIFEKEEVEPPVLKFFRGQDLPANCSQFLLLEDVAVISQSEVGFSSSGSGRISHSCKKNSSPTYIYNDSYLGNTLLQRS